MKVKAILLIALVLCIQSTPVLAAEQETQINVYVDNSIPIERSTVPKMIGGKGLRGITGTWSYSIKWATAEANSYTDSNKTTRWPIDRICANYLNVSSKGEVLQSIFDDQTNASHAQISAKSVYVTATKKGKYIFEHSGYETLDVSLEY